MHKATIVTDSPLLGVRTHTVEDEDISMFHARLVGTLEGLTASQSIITSVVTDREYV